MPTVTLDTLPGDVLDLIFQFLEADLREEEERRIRIGGSIAPLRLKTLRRFCLVNRALLPVARRFLYARPLDRNDMIWKHALSLVTALSANNNALGRLVRSLTNLALFESDLRDDREPASMPSCMHEYFRTQPMAYSWLLAMLAACPHLNKVDLVFETSAEIKLVLRALRPSLPTLRSMEIVSVSSYKLDRSHLRRFFRKLGLKELDHFELRFGTAAPAKPCRIPLRLRSLSLALHEGTVPLYHFLPPQPSYLRSLRLDSVDPNTPPHEILALFLLAGASLTTLYLDTAQTTRWGPCPCSVSDFNPPQTVFLPEGLFSRLPTIRHLTLHHCCGLTIESIRALSNSSPNLVKLDLRACCWNDNDPDPDDDDWDWDFDHLSLEELANVFRSFRQLKYVEVGRIPLETDGEPTMLKSALEAQGVEVVGRSCFEADYD
ncbi:hypothetical protein JCM8097_007091 [Rhodosporidiobolus ruineniae]